MLDTGYYGTMADARFWISPKINSAQYPMIKFLIIVNWKFLVDYWTLVFSLIQYPRKTKPRKRILVFAAYWFTRHRISITAIFNTIGKMQMFFAQRA